MPGASALYAVGWLALLHLGQAQIMSVDLGHEFFKVAVMRQGRPLEIMLNAHSKRKTSTAVSFAEPIRAFGDDALVHQGKKPMKVPMFIHSMMGDNFTAEDVSAGGKWWDRFGLGSRFYTFNHGYEAERGVPTYKVTDGNDTSPEEVLAHILHAAQKMTEEDGKPARDLVVTITSDANLRQRQAVAAAGEIAGLRLQTLVHEGAGFAIQRAVDYMPEKGESEVILFYNMGSRKTEVTIANFSSRSAGMVAGKMAPVVTILGSAVNFEIGGHLMDLKIADDMLQKFKDKNPKLADGVEKDSRALRKLLTQAQKTKAILSSNKVAPFQVESLYMDTDFVTTIKREDFEAMIKDQFLARLTVPIDQALAKANLTMADVTQVEVVGGAWRVPSVQQTLGQFFEEKGSKKLPLGQHLNGEEASALGAALVAANASSSFRTKKIFFSDFTSHEYGVQVAALNGEWEKNITVLYPVGVPLGGKKKLTFSSSDDFVVRLFEDGVLLSEYVVQGVTELLEGKWKEYNMTGPPKIAASVPLEMSGLIEVKTPTATVEELYWVNTTKPKVKAKPNASDDNNTNGTDNATAGDEDSSESTQATNGSNSSNGTNETEEVEIVTKQKKKKHEKKLTMKRIDFAPKPLSEEAKKELKAKLEAMAEAEAEVLAVAGMKNDLEASIYASREKLELEGIMKVSTEEQREEVNKLCMEYEEWLYESGATKSDYEQRLNKLQDLLGPMEERATELEARPDVEEQVQDGLSDVKKVHAHIAKNMSWVNPNKTQDALKRLEEFEEWWKKKTESQKKLPLTEAPAYTRKEAIDKLTGIQKEWEKLKKTKKPKEAPKPKAAKNKTAGGDGKDTKEEKKEEELPSDPAEVEKLLASLREEKAAAVAAEDFDKAQSLKSREAALTKQLEKLKAEL
mmetsp:Transcript_63526/g.125689  ORF Transcript_63526/g.125689 Transcript_63526/m.125689 type:complete len:909 (+) Transcript_63526:90-2816(+)